jgi:hypothetical protein
MRHILASVGKEGALRRQLSAQSHLDRSVELEQRQRSLRNFMTCTMSMCDHLLRTLRVYQIRRT